MKKLLFISLFTISLFHTSLFGQWIKQTIPVNKSISGIKFIDSLKGWACTSISTLGDSSFIMHTTNGGVNWNIQLTVANIALYAISIIDANTGYCGGSSGPGRLFKTTNGGINWNEIGTPTRVTDMFFVNKDSGWICNETSTADVRTTTNGGATWQLRNSGLSDNINRLFFLNYSTGWAGSTYFKKTTNAGLNWVQIYDFATDIYSLYFINELIGWVGLSNNRIRYTTDGGFNWSAQTVSPPTGIVYDFYFLNSNIGWAGFLDDRIFKTTNAGTTWGYQNDSSGSYRISFIDSMKGWTGQTGISKTTNGGGPVFYTGFTPAGTSVPNRFTLYQNYPNPFNPYTTIKLEVSERSVVQLYISDVLGRTKYEIVNQSLGAGTYEFNWDSRDFSSGVYFYTLISGNNRETKKMLLVK